MFKSVLIIVVVVVLLLLIRSVTQRVKQPPRKETIKSNDTVQCLHCKTYVPREDAVLKGDNAFCSTQHLNDWNQSA